jgi:hypothetical protein
MDLSCLHREYLLDLESLWLIYQTLMSLNDMCFNLKSIYFDSE